MPMQNLHNLSRKAITGKPLRECAIFELIAYKPWAIGHTRGFWHTHTRDF